jgi:hypothetical protein
MTRTINIKGKEYCVVTTTFTAHGVETYVQINIDISKLDASERLIIVRNANLFFNRPFKIAKSQPETKKPWWKVW